ncbi:MAG: hypothetical protein HF962_05490 [Sulfurovum sp.]|nr:hypothetical protein [Sulfurovum sp.]
MYHKKKERIYISDLLSDPAVQYPAYYTLSNHMCKNEMLLSALEMLHGFDFDGLCVPKKYEEIFSAFSSGAFPIYKEKYIVGYFGGKMMYLESIGWKGMPVTASIFELDNWLL